ncbi:Radical SAM superfamily protein [uncultured archaeon]|nr:Radical SAM superfamily protein [uncultured archaeon]
MQRPILNPELFVFPVDSKEDKLVLYAPLEGSAAEINPDMLFLLQNLNQDQEIDFENPIFKRLKDSKIILDSQPDSEDKKESKLDYCPTHLTILPTFNCNLRCVYCYSNGGEKPITLDLEIARKAIDLLTYNISKTNSKKASLGFHGGGEPLLEENLDLVKRCVEYFRSQMEDKGIESRVVAATNGVMEEDSLEWISSNFDFINISLDGPAPIQDAQRPQKGGKPSFPYVMNTINFFEEKGLDYGIRSTITAESVTQMPEILSFFSEITKIKSIQFEPLYECGRCKTTKVRAPDPKIFIDYFLRSIEVAKEKQIKLLYSGSKVSTPSQNFCGASGNNFFLTPQGNVTTCLEVSREEDFGAKVFLIGKYDSDNKEFIFDDQKINHLKNRRVSNLSHCSDCFAKYSCSGDCLSKCYLSSGSIYDTSNNPRCEINRQLHKAQIINTLKGGNKNG